MHFSRSSLYVAAVLAMTSLIGFGTPQSKSPTTKRPPSSTKAKTFKYTLTIGGKKYALTSDKELPLAELNRGVQGSDQSAALRSELAATKSRLAMLQRSLLADAGLKSKVEQLESQVEELTSEKEDFEEQVEELKEKVDELETSLEDIQSKASEVSSAYDFAEIEFSSLKRTVGWFGYMDWKSVVPDVERRTKRLESELDDLKDAIDDLELLGSHHTPNHPAPSQ